MPNYAARTTTLRWSFEVHGRLVLRSFNEVGRASNAGRIQGQRPGVGIPKGARNKRPLGLPAGEKEN